MNSKERFKKAIACGTGEAYLLLKNNQDIDFSKEILKASFANLAYDPQCEDRGYYIATLIMQSTRKEKIIAQILSKLIKQKEANWGLHQMFEIALFFAQRDNIQAREAIYKRFELNLSDGYDYCGQTTILELDGPDGMMRVAELRGKMLLENPDDWEDDATIRIFDEENPNANIKQTLNTFAKRNIYVRHYLKAIKENRKTREENYIKQDDSYSSIKDRIDNNSGIPASLSGIKKLSRSDLNKLADAFVEERDKKKQIKYLRIFSKRSFPKDHIIILNMLKKANAVKDVLLIDHTVRILQNYESDEIRNLAIEKIKNSKKPYLYFSLLCSNYKKGDAKLLNTIASKYINKHLIETMAIGLINIYTMNKVRECKLPLETTYNKLTCGIHRTDVVKLMIENKVLPSKIKKEIAFDSNEHTRRLAVLSH